VISPSSADSSTRSGQLLQQPALITQIQSSGPGTGDMLIDQIDAGLPDALLTDLPDSAAAASAFAPVVVIGLTL
jgi:hypothetical protein